MVKEIDENTRLFSSRFMKQKEYWKNKLSGDITGTKILFQGEESGRTHAGNKEAEIIISAHLSGQLMKLGKKSDISIYIILSAALKSLIARYTGSRDIVIFSPVYTPHVSGHTMNNRLFIRDRLHENITFKELLLTVRQSVLEAYENQDYPSNKLPDYPRLIPGISCSLKNIHEEIAITDTDTEISFSFIREGERLYGKISYPPGPFREDYIKQISNHFTGILRAALDNVAVVISDISFLSKDEKEQLLFDFNTPAKGALHEKLIVELFEDLVDKMPGHIAVVHKDGQFTFGELNGKANRLAGALRSRGVKPGSITAIMVEPSLEMLSWILAVLKAGGAYLPIDPEYPRQRISFMLTDSAASILLAKRDVLKDIEGIKTGIIFPDDTDVNGNPVHFSANKPGDPAYIIYTSGSTGAPKGVMVEHKNLSSYVKAFNRVVEITPGDVMIQQASFSFDTYLEEVFPVLLKGGKLAVPRKYEILDMDLLSHFILKYDVNMIDCSPLLLKELNKLKPVPRLDTVISGGDVLRMAYVDNLLKEGKVYNSYGPTETTICAAFHRCSPGDGSSIPIGKPVSNAQVFILDKNNQLLPIGTAGELCISGSGVSRGYLNRPELTGEKIINKKFFGGSRGAIFQKSPPGRRRQRIYKTGDRGLWQPDGNLKFLGRIDHQVKIRGYRIELGEIENKLSKHEDITKAAVVLKEDKSVGSYICAHFEAKQEQNLVNLRDFLSRDLPHYMIPSRFVQLDKIPLTPSGKVDRKFLIQRDEEGTVAGREYIAPRNEIEKKMAAIWQEIFKSKQIGIEDNFFELGGDSLLVIQAIARMREEFSVELPLKSFFQRPVIRELVEEVKHRQEEGLCIKPVPRDGKMRIPLSFAQERLWFLQQLDGANMAYHVPRALLVKGNLAVEMLEQALTLLIRRHEILRTVFPVGDGGPEQRILAPYEFKITVSDLSDWDHEEQSGRVSELILREGRREFDLAKGPLLRVTLGKLEENKHLLVLTEHHLIHDGWTQGVLLKEFITVFSDILEGKTPQLPPLPIQYADYAVWQRNFLQGDVLEGHLDYWREKLSGLAPVLNLPLDYPRPPVNTGQGGEKRLILSKKFSEALKIFSREREVTLFMTMLTAFKVLLYRYTGIEDLCVGTGAANRRYKETEGMLGMVINTLPLRTLVSKDLSGGECLERVKTTCLESYEHEDTPFGKIVEAMQPERSLSYTPIFQVGFSFMDTPGHRLQLPGLELEIQHSHNRSSKFDINVIVVPPTELRREETDGPIIMWEYNTDIFEQDTAARMLRHYNRLLEQITTNPNEKISTLPMLETPEIEQLLFDFNNTKTGYREDKTVHELFEEEVEKTPDCAAVVYEDVTLTYSQLNRKANRLAGLLRAKGIKPDTAVGIMIGRSPGMMVGIMAILKAGGAYVPIAPDYPEERKKYLLSDSNAVTLLTRGHTKEDSLVIDNEGIDQGDASNPKNINKPGNLAYIIYTSGTTGKPKGVMVEHRNINNLIVGLNERIYKKYGKGLKIGLVAPYEFDASVKQIFAALLLGHSLYITPESARVDGRNLLEYLKKHTIDISDGTPTHIRLMLESPGGTVPGINIKHFLIGGEALPLKITEEFLNCFETKPPKITNVYGPTECSVDSTSYEISKETIGALSTVPIGKPMPNVKAYILDSENQPVPVGVPGELCIGGDGVARGYSGSCELTAEKFTNNPFLKEGRMYRTGDLAKWLPDGGIEYCGRIDNQVKIRGYRIESEEIENRLITHEKIKEAVVVDRLDDEGEKYLCAYVVLNREKENHLHEIERVLKGKPRCKLPNNLTIAHLNKNETDFLYKEQFEVQAYFKNGISIEDGDCIFDVGANIGLFALSAHLRKKNLKIFTFEPNPFVSEILRLNMKLYGVNAGLYDCGLSGNTGENIFTFYHGFSFLSGFYADERDEKEVVRAYLTHEKQKGSNDMTSLDPDANGLIDELLEHKFKSEKFEVKLRTLSGIIEENKIQCIDLLKINVEKSEYDVLSGIKETDWQKIKQIALEVHDIDGRLNKIISLLEKHGFNAVVEQDWTFAKSVKTNYYVYARREPGVPGGEPRPEFVIRESFPLNFDGSVDGLELREYLLKELPGYMIPSHFVRLNKLPVNPNGKIDRKRLPLPGSEGRKYAAPRNPLEEKLVGLWSDVLARKKEPPGIDDNFFECGGHSLKAVHLINKIQTEFHVKLPMVEIFKRPTVRGLSGFIAGAVAERRAPVEPAEIREYHRQSSAQKRLYVIHRLAEGGTGYNIPLAAVLEGDINKEKLEDIFYRLIRRHESLRTSFRMMEQEPVQKIHKRVEFAVEYYDKSHVPLAVKEIMEGFTRPFDLYRPPLLRVGLIKEEERKHLLMVDIHHIVSDGMSMEILIKEFIWLYGEKELPLLRLQYRDYCEWQHAARETGEYLRQAGYWLKQFQDEIPVLELPVDFARPRIQRFEGRRMDFEIPAGEMQQLKSLALQESTTLFMVLLAVYSVFLAKISNCQSIMVGIPVAGRGHPDLEQIIGMFINTLALKYQPDSRKTFLQFLEEVNKKTLAALENQDYPFEELVDRLDINRDTSRNPLFDTMFALQNLETSEPGIPGLKIKPYAHEIIVSKFDLTLQAKETKENLLFIFEYSTNLFKESTIHRFIGYFKQIIAGAAAGPTLEITGIEIISEKEKKQLLVDFNRTSREYPKDKTIPRLFEEEVAGVPDRTAVKSMEGSNLISITYRELNRKSDQLAYWLREEGVTAGDIVGLLLERSIDMVVGILGILKAGAAYMPLDHRYPGERIKYMFKDSCTRGVVTRLDLVRRFSYIDNVFAMENMKPVNVKHTAAGPGQYTSSGSGAYIIYTSGTSGKPKGVFTNHFNAVRVVKGTDYIDIKENDRVLQWSNYAFDGSVFDIFGALLNGAALVLVPKGEAADLPKLSGLIIREQITLFFVTTALFNGLVDTGPACLKDIRKILFGGERVSVEHTRKALQYLGPGKIIHVYGPTETTVYAAGYDIDRVEDHAVTIPIGKPIANTTAYVLNGDLKPVPMGIVGELYIGGDGMAKGYLNNPELTAEKFVHPSPFYKTGDLARWLPPGNIEFIGRVDQQVKIRGFRIELGEIEGLLSNHGAVKDAVVIDKEKAGDRYLCAYVVLKNKGTPARELQEFLLQELPAFMVPAYFIFIDKVPLNVNGKVDRKALPQPEEVGIEGDVEAPRDALEKELANLWADVLGIKIENIGIDSDFFQLGGHSLKAAVLVSGIHKVFNAAVPLTGVFASPTLRELAVYIRKAARDKYISISPMEERDFYPVSSAQGRLYVLQQMDAGGIAYNIPSLSILAGNVDKDRLESAFRRLIKRHESLRTSFPVVNREPVQRIQQETEFNVVLEVSQDLQHSIKRFLRPFDLSKAPLFRVGLVKIKEKSHLLMVDLHHIISDGISHGILTKDFPALYEGKELPALRLQYKDYSGWQQDQVEKQVLKRQEEYWLKELDGEIPVLELPTDYSRPPIQGFEGDECFFELNEDLAGALKEMAQSRGSTLFMVLIAAYFIFISKITGQEDMVVGTPIAGRSHADLGQIMGMFVNTLALRISLSAEMTFAGFLNHVKERTLKAFDNQDYPFENLVEKVAVERDMGRSPVFDVLFVLQNLPVERGETAPQKSGELEIKPYDYKSGTSKFDLTLRAVERANKLAFTFEYCTRLFREETIEKFITFFKTMVSAVVENPEKKISAIEIIPAKERERILYDFNGIKTGYPRDKVIHRLFEERVRERADKIALIFEDEELSYRHLNEKSNRVAHCLREKGIGPDTIVGIMVEPSIEMVIGIFAVLKAGGAYLPIDPGYPEERKQYMLADSNAKVLVTAGTFENLPPFFPSSLLPFYPSDPSGLAYITYTSGTTGKPKGALIEHKNVVRLMVNDKNPFDFKDSDVWTMFHSFCFDFSVWELYGALLYGGKLILISKAAARAPRQYLKILKKERVTVLNQTPAAFYNLLNEESTCKTNELALRYVIFGGEALMPGKLKKWQEKYPGTRSINMYGITETTVHVTYKEIGEKEIEGGRSNIGRAIPTLYTLVMDKDSNPAPIGIPGELYIGGEGVARGYLNRPELTREKFVKNPYKPGEKLYRSGDRVKLTDRAGDMEYLGRIDHQVKIRGFRVELGEIESQLLKHEDIKEAVVRLKKEAEESNNHLFAYIAAQRELKVSQLREYLAGKLPVYMIPSFFVQVEKIPLTPNGKVDKKALDLLGKRLTADSVYAPPQNEIEKKIVDAWREVLHLDKVGIHDNYFDLGGTSIEIVRINAKLREIFQVDIPVVDMFRYTTIRSLANYLIDKEQEIPGRAIEYKGGKGERVREQESGLEIAVIGMAGRFPGAGNLEEFWNNLKNGIESITFFPVEQLKDAGVEPGLLRDPNYVKAKGVLEDIEYFDAPFFGYTPREAEIMDPQMRIFHECVWSALEDAGYDPGTYEGSIGLYAGASPNLEWEARALLSDKGNEIGYFAANQLTRRDYVTLRISYKLDLKGPSFVVNTACSTSLVAVHLACQALLDGECSMALAGGVTVVNLEKRGYQYQEGMILSPDGHCKAFDAAAKGTVGGDGTGAAVLKPLKHAVRDRDHIYAVIKGSAINNDGIRKVGFSASSVEGQAEVIKMALETAAVEPESIHYIETHGTATELGDPVEIEALKLAFNTNKKAFCAVGSIKSNIGHLDAAAGIAGFIKTVLALQHKLIPPSLYFETPNPGIDFIDSPFYVNTGPAEWEKETGRYPLRAGVSSFGMGGTNAHVVLEEWPGGREHGREDEGREYRLILLSAGTEPALDKMKQNLAEYLQENPGISLADASYTLQVGRRVFKHRWTAVCSSAAEAIEALSSQEKKETHIEPLTDANCRQLIQTGRLWLQGKNIDWKEFYSLQQYQPYRVSLPTYPFEKRRYWIEEDADMLKRGMQAMKKNVPLTGTRDGAADDFFYLPTWKRVPLVIQKNKPLPPRKQWLVFVNDRSPGKLLVKTLTRKQQDVVTVKIGKEFCRGEGDGYTYTINPTESHHYETLFAELQTAAMLPDKIIHCWNVTGENSPLLEGNSFDEAQYRGFYSFLYMAKAMGKQDFNKDIHIFALSDHLQEIRGDERLCPVKSTALGLLKVIPQEYPGLRCCSIDIDSDPPEPGSPGEAMLMNSLLEEFTGDPVDTAIAFRKNQRWVQMFEPLHWDESKEEGPGFRKQGVYLVTGGLGAIGLMFSELLVKHAQARLILTGRSPFPARNEWSHWLKTHEDPNPVSLKIEKLRQLEEMGGQVLYFQADAADPERMRRVVTHAEENIGEINGVIHSAGTIDSMKTIQELSREDCRLQFQSKVYGVMVLNELFKEKQLDFCWMLSSISCVLGGLGFGAYASANLFMDVFVKMHNRGGGSHSRWFTLNWDGMDAEPSIRTFERIFQLENIEQIVFSNQGNLQARIDRWIKLEGVKSGAYSRDEQTTALYPRPDLSTAYTGPRTPIEQALVGIWQGLLGFAEIGVHDDFLELGGDSLKAITAISGIHRELNVNIPVTRFFAKPTIEALAQYIPGNVNARGDEYESIKPIETKAFYPLSSSQKRLFVIRQKDENSIGYNISLVMAVEGKLLREKFEQTFAKLIHRHESLRTSFEMIHDEPVQRIHDDVVFEMEYYESGKKGGAPGAAIKDFIRPFDLSRAPLLRVGVIHTPTPGDRDRYILMLDMHHIISDGVSLTILVTDFCLCYAEKDLPPLRVQYKDFSAWQYSEKQAKEMSKQEEYWLKEFEQGIPGLDLPTDYPRPLSQDFAGDTIDFEIDKDKLKDLKKLAAAGNTTLFTVLITIYYVFLFKLSGREDIVVGTGAAGRRDPDLQQIIGMFVNTLALRNQPRGEKTFKQFLKDVKEKALTAFENQDYPFEKLVEKVVPDRNQNRNPIFDVVIVSQTMEAGTGNIGGGEFELPGLKLKPYPYKNRVSNFDLGLLCTEVGEKLYLTFVYCTKLFNKETIERFILYFNEIAAAVIGTGDVPLDDITISHDLLTAEPDEDEEQMEIEL